ncbi:MAG TPA: hypothetical protein VMS77_06590 [Conexivisphaerales archaeon]|nr:hypothetical protein [Conexivisphaerales archaeon]
MNPKTVSHPRAKDFVIIALVVVALTIPVLAVLWSPASTDALHVTYNTQGWLVTSEEAQQLLAAGGRSVMQPTFVPNGLKLQAVLVFDSNTLNDSSGGITYVYSYTSLNTVSSPSENAWSKILGRKVQFIEILGSSKMGEPYQLDLTVTPPDSAWTSAAPSEAQAVINQKIDAWIAKINTTFNGTNLVTISREQLLGVPADIRVQKEGTTKNAIGETIGFEYSGIYIGIYSPGGSYVIRSVLSMDDTMKLVTSMR